MRKHAWSCVSSIAELIPIVGKSQRGIVVNTLAHLANNQPYEYRRPGKEIMPLQWCLTATKYE
jgi:hypothetical protein